VDLFVLDEAYPGFGLGFSKEVAAGDVFIVSFKNRPFSFQNIFLNII